MISLAGVPLLQPDPETLARLESGTVMRELWQFVRRELPPTMQGLASLPCPPNWFDARLGVLYWPQGASNFTWGRYVVGEEGLAQIRAYVNADGLRPAPFILDDGRQSITTDLWMLPTRPLEQCLVNGGEGFLPGAHLITLVDERFHWWLRAAEQVEVVYGETTWADLIDQVAALIGIVTGVTIDEVDPRYLFPGLYLAQRNEPLPLLMDAICEACGLKFVRDLDGTNRALLLASSKERLRYNLEQHGSGRLQGGRMLLTSRADTDAALPEFVEVIFPIIDQGSLAGEAYLSSIAVADLNDALGSNTVRGTPGDVKVLKRAEPAYGFAPGNQDDLEALALITAIDWCGHQLGPLDEAFEGVRSWLMEGLSTLVIYEHLPGLIQTRVKRAPWWQIGMESFGPGIDYYPDSSVFYDRPNFTYSGGTTTYDGTVTTLLLENGTPLLFEDNSTVEIDAPYNLIFRTSTSTYTQFSQTIYQSGSRITYDGPQYLLFEDLSRILTEDGRPILDSPAILITYPGLVRQEFTFDQETNVTTGVNVTFTGGGTIVYDGPSFRYSTDTTYLIEQDVNVTYTGTGTIVYDGPSFTVTTSTTYNVPPGINVTYTGGGTVTLDNVTLQVNSPLYYGYEIVTFAPTLPTPQKPLILVDVPVAPPLRGLGVPMDVTKPQRFTVVNLGVNKGTVLDNDTAGGTSQSSIRTSTGGTIDWPSNTALEMLFDPTIGQYRALNDPGVTSDDVSTSAHGLCPQITGSDGDVLTKSGTEAVWSTPTTGGSSTATLIASSVNFSGQTAVAFTGLTGYKFYRVIGEYLQSSVGMGATLSMRTSTNGGSSYDSGGSDYKTNGSATSAMNIGTIRSDGGTDSSSFDLILYDPANTSVKKQAKWELVDTATASLNAGTREATDDVDAIQFFPSSGTFKGTLLVYGWT